MAYKTVHRLVAVATVFACAWPLAAGMQAPTELPGNRQVVDRYGALTEAEREGLERRLTEYRETTTNDIAVFITDTTNGRPIADVSLETFRLWKLGTAENQNGVLLFIAIADRELWITTGYGLEGALPDLLVKRIIDSEITPSFKSGNYAQGIERGVTAIMAAAQGEYTPTETYTSVPLLVLFIIFATFATVICFAVNMVRYMHRRLDEQRARFGRPAERVTAPLGMAKLIQPFLRPVTSAADAAVQAACGGIAIAAIGILALYILAKLPSAIAMGIVVSMFALCVVAFFAFMVGMFVHDYRTQRKLATTEAARIASLGCRPPRGWLGVYSRFAVLVCSESTRERAFVVAATRNVAPLIFFTVVLLMSSGMRALTPIGILWSGYLVIASIIGYLGMRVWDRRTDPRILTWLSQAKEWQKHYPNSSGWGRTTSRSSGGSSSGSSFSSRGGSSGGGGAGGRW